MEEQRFNKNTNWKVKCERMSTEKRDKSTDGDNPVIFNIDTNQYEGWNGTEWIALAGGGSGPGDSLWENGSGVNSLKPKNQTNIASGENSIAIGLDNEVKSSNSVAIGRELFIDAIQSAAFGFENRATTRYSFVHGTKNEANGQYSHAEGRECFARGDGSHAEGTGCEADGEGSHAEGGGTKATQTYAHSEGFRTEAKGQLSHAEGQETVSGGLASHSEGFKTEARGDYSHAEGVENITQSYGEMKVGTYGTPSPTNDNSGFDINDRAFSVGIGDSDSNRIDGLVVNKDGSVLAPIAATLYDSGIYNNIVVTKKVLDNVINIISANIQLATTSYGHIGITNDAPFTTTLDTPQLVDTWDFNLLLDGTYELSVAIEWGLNAVNQDAIFRFDVNGVQGITVNQEPKDATNRIFLTTFVLDNLSVGANRIEFFANKENDNTNILTIYSSRFTARKITTLS